MVLFFSQLILSQSSVHKLGEKIEIGDVVYKVNKISYNKSFRGEITEGQFLFVEITIFTKKQINCSYDHYSDDFRTGSPCYADDIKIFDEDGNVFDRVDIMEFKKFSGLYSEKEFTFPRTAKPKINYICKLLFEVPSTKEVYTLQLRALSGERINFKLKK